MNNKDNQLVIYLDPNKLTKQQMNSKVLEQINMFRNKDFMIEYSKNKYNIYEVIIHFYPKENIFRKRFHIVKNYDDLQKLESDLGIALNIQTKRQEDRKKSQKNEKNLAKDFKNFESNCKILVINIKQKLKERSKKTKVKTEVKEAVKEKIKVNENKDLNIQQKDITKNENQIYIDELINNKIDENQIEYLKYKMNNNYYNFSDSNKTQEDKGNDQVEKLSNSDIFENKKQGHINEILNNINSNNIDNSDNIVKINDHDENYLKYNPFENYNSTYNNNNNNDKDVKIQNPFNIFTSIIDQSIQKQKEIDQKKKIDSKNNNQRLYGNYKQTKKYKPL